MRDTWPRLEQIPFPAIRRGARYVATLDFNDVNGVEVRRTATLIGG